MSSTHWLNARIPIATAKAVATATTTYFMPLLLHLMQRTCCTSLGTGMGQPVDKPIPLRVQPRVVCTRVPTHGLILVENSSSHTDHAIWLASAEASSIASLLLLMKVVFGQSVEPPTPPDIERCDHSLAPLLQIVVGANQ